MEKAIFNPIQDIYQFFKDSKGNVQLEKMLKYIEEDQTIKNKSSIFLKKIQAAIGRKRVLTREEFMSYFNQTASNPDHFEIVFSAIDTDNTGYISKRQLKQLLQNNNLDASKNTINLMMEVCSEDGQKVKKEDLRQFLKGE